MKLSNRPQVSQRALDMRPSLLSLIGVVFVLVGCSSRYAPPSADITVSGTVMIDGKRLEKGRIVFRGKDQLPTGGVIEDGKYTCRSWPGPMIVEIRAFHEMAPATPIPGMNHVVEVNYLPARFNDESSLRAEVVDGGPNVFNFEVSSR